MPHSIPKGLTAEHVLQALADLDGGIDHPFGAPTGYELIHEGKRYPPKAVIGLAYRRLAGRLLGPEEFSGGEAPGQANFVLWELGFTIERKGSGSLLDSTEEVLERGRPWSRDEVNLIVADYFTMLRAELAGESYSKAEHNRTLQPLLDGRSKSSVEFKHQNISAVLVSMGLPYIDGYKPAKNYQKTVLPQAIDDYLIRHSEMLQSLAESPILNPTTPPPIPDRPAVDLFEPRPDHIIVTSSDGKPWLSRKGRKIDFARRDAMNRHLGHLGEEFALDVEQKRLLECGRDDLAAKVEWVAETCGDGIGFDLLSFDESDDSEWWIEIKTTGLGKHFPFHVTANEVRCSEDCPERFRLYRVFDFARDPRIYVVGGGIVSGVQAGAGGVPGVGLIKHSNLFPITDQINPGYGRPLKSLFVNIWVCVVISFCWGRVCTIPTLWNQFLAFPPPSNDGFLEPWDFQIGMIGYYDL